MNKNAPPVLKHGYIIYAAFIVGLLSALAIRALVVITHIDPDWVRPVWYFAIISNFAFFYYRFGISRKRRAAIEDYRLIEKIESGQCPTGEDREVLLYLLGSIRVSLENYNYLIIFIFSLVAIALDLVLTYL